MLEVKEKGAVNLNKITGQEEKKEQYFLNDAS